MKKLIIIAALVMAALGVFGFLAGVHTEKSAGPQEAAAKPQALSPCAAFKGEEKLCESALENLTSAFNNSVAYAVEKYADAEYSDAWKIYIEMPSMIMDQKTNKSTNKMAFIFDKKTETIRFYDFVPLNE